MSIKYKEKISSLYALSDTNGPTAFITSDTFPVNKAVKITCLLFNLNISKDYLITTEITTSNEVIIFTRVPYKVNTHTLSIPPIDNLASTLISIETPQVNFTKDKDYKITVTLSTSENNNLHENSTYVRTIIDGE